MSRSTRIESTCLLFALAVFVGACRSDEVEPVAETVEESSALVTPMEGEAPTAEPTVVRRAQPTPTPTVDPKADPFFPVEIEELAGVPVPVGAELIEFVPATDVGDARADFSMPDVDADEIEAWFLETMPEYGWSDGDERPGGGLVFLHGDELSERYASEGLKRTATVIFDTVDENADFSLLVEAAAQ